MRDLPDLFQPACDVLSKKPKLLFEALRKKTVARLQHIKGRCHTVGSRLYLVQCFTLIGTYKTAPLPL